MRHPFFAGLLATLLGCTAGWAAEDPRPNFVVILIDDLGYGDVGPFGSTRNRTPHLDQMAREGCRLTSHYAAPVCSPCRAALMTGCYPKRALPIPHVLFPVSAVGLNPAEVTLAEILKTRGYATCAIGKWHLGDQSEFLPTQQGFDEYFGLPYSNDMGTAAEGAKSNLGQPLPKPSVPGTKKQAAAATNDEYGLRGASQPPLPLLKGDRVIERVDAAGQQALTERYTQAALEFLRTHREQPFFLYLPHTAIHFPLYPSETYRGKSANGLLGDWIEEMDASVGRVLDELRRLKLSEKTLVIFTSDNGGSVPHGSTNHPLRGTKGQTFEGGIRVPTIAWWPGKIPANSSSAEVTAMMDLLPTFAELAGAKLPEDRVIDGRSLWPLLSHPTTATSPHEAFYYYRGLSLEAVRSGPWKLHLQSGELYHLDQDIAEKINIADQHGPEVARLRDLANRMDQDLGMTGVGAGCRPLGRVDSPRPLIADSEPAPMK